MRLKTKSTHGSGKDDFARKEKKRNGGKRNNRRQALPLIVALLGISLLPLAGCSATNQPPSATTSASSNSGTTANASNSSADSGTAQVSVQGRWVTVARAVDGDTLELTSGEKVRLIGVNTPETVKPNTPEQPYGKEASNFTKSQLNGKKVLLETDVQTKDKYGRILGYVYLQQPKTQADLEKYMFNAILLREGYAQVMTIPPNVKYQDLFVKLQRQAREQNKGLWALHIYKDSATSTNDVFLPGKNPTSSSSHGSSSSSSTSPQASHSGPGPHGETIKGNINSKGEKIYHLPGDPYYDKTVPEAWFFTEQDAQAAGFRPAKN